MEKADLFAATSRSDRPGVFEPVTLLSALPIPKPLGNYLDLLAAAAGPAARFTLGLSLVGRQLTAGIGEVSWLVAIEALRGDRLIQPLAAKHQVHPSYVGE